ncbi:MAG: hypothetical protein PHN78_00580, partial [Dehalococcoidales bacterium]|nr:hypothetical protein [Dehalococcoidales bacterium]
RQLQIRPSQKVYGYLANLSQSRHQAIAPNSNLSIEVLYMWTRDDLNDSMNNQTTGTPFCSGI